MEYYKQLYANKVDNIGERDKLLERHKLLKLTQVDIKCLNNSVTNKDIKLVTENVSTKKSPDEDDFTGKFKHSKKLKPIFHKLFQTVKEEEIIFNSFYEDSIILISN